MGDRWGGGRGNPAIQCRNSECQVDRNLLASSCSQASLEFVKSGEYALERMGFVYPAKAHTRSPFDPDNKRVKGVY